MCDFISTSVPCETLYYIRANEEACQLRAVGAPAAVVTEKELEPAVARPLLYSDGSQFSCIPFRLHCQAWGTRSVPLQRLPGIHSVLQYNANSRGGGILPSVSR